MGAGEWDSRARECSRWAVRSPHPRKSSSRSVRMRKEQRKLIEVAFLCCANVHEVSEFQGRLRHRMAKDVSVPRPTLAHQES